MKDLKVMWSVESALRAHERQPKGTFINKMSFNDYSDHVIRRDNKVVMVDGPDTGREAFVVGWVTKGVSVRVRFDEREAVVRRSWLKEVE